jgi:hypothetical protein
VVAQTGDTSVPFRQRVLIQNRLIRSVNDARCWFARNSHIRVRSLEGESPLKQSLSQVRLGIDQFDQVGVSVPNHMSLGKPQRNENALFGFLSPTDYHALFIARTDDGYDMN